jgi:4,5-DOPA dioxygenase extradiol
METNKSTHSPTRMPVLFIGHGSPENTLEDNEFTQVWKQLAGSMPHPRAILCLSAHWTTEGSFATAMEKPKTIHDFSGFSEELFAFKYPASGSLQLAERLCRLVTSVKVAADYEWGLDHGTWSVLANMYPKADIPVVQMSLDLSCTPDQQFRLGQELSPLRNEGVLILGSGNVVHNLMALRFDGSPFDWAVHFDNFVKESIECKDYRLLLRYQRQPTARFAHPTADHFFPLLYSAGASGDDAPRFFNEGFFAGSIGMRSVVWGD